jgi:hypothetical protein
LPYRWRGLLAWRYSRVQAAKGIARLDRERGIAALVTLAADPGLAADDARLEAANALTALDQIRGTDALAALAADATLDYAYRPDAAQQLAVTNPGRGMQVLAMAADPTLSAWSRQRAAIDLTWQKNMTTTRRLSPPSPTGPRQPRPGTRLPRLPGTPPRRSQPTRPTALLTALVTPSATTSDSGVPSSTLRCARSGRPG